MPAAAIFFFALVRRAAIASVLSRKAVAISCVVNPPNVRSVSAMRDFFFKRGMAAGEDHLQTLVDHQFRGSVILRLMFKIEQVREFSLFGCESGVASQSVNRLSARSGDEPCSRTFWQAITVPMVHCRDHGFLKTVLRKLNVAECLDERCKNAPPLFANRLFDGPFRREWGQHDGQRCSA